MSDDNVRRWRMRDGTLISVEDMATSHIENSLALLKRKNCVGERELAFCLLGPRPNGEHAQEAHSEALLEILDRPFSPFVDIFEDELKRRAEAVDQ